MSDLLKKALQKNKPPQKPQEGLNQDQEEDIAEEDEEEKDQFEQDINVKQFPASKQMPIKPTEHFNIPNNPQVKQIKNNPLKKDYEPSSWNKYYDEREYMKNGTPIYKAGNHYPIFFCLHGAGDSAQSFACLAGEVKKFATLISFDFRGHGENQMTENVEDLSLQTLLQDTTVVFDYVVNKYQDSTIIIVGHSMGGAIASKFAEQVSNSKYANRVQGLIVIDVVEGTALEALPFMEQVVNSYPKSFKDVQSAIQWGIRAQVVRNLESAKVSFPPKLHPIKNQNGQIEKYVWKVDLLKSSQHWTSWFKGLTNSFLGVKYPKLLMVAEKERMDKELTIAHMQGKFCLIVIYNVGHYMQEDDFMTAAQHFHHFICGFKIPVSMKEVDLLKQVGVGKFQPDIKPYEGKPIFYDC